MTDQPTDAVEAVEAATAAAIAFKATIGGAVTTILGWVTKVDFLTILGVWIALGGFLSNIYFRRRDVKRLESATRLRMELMQKHNDRAAELHRLKVEFLTRQPDGESDLAKLFGADSSDFEDVYKEPKL